MIPENAYFRPCYQHNSLSFIRSPWILHMTGLKIWWLRLWGDTVHIVLRSEYTKDRITTIYQRFSDRTLFPDDSFCCFLGMKLKLGIQLDFKVIQHILFWSYSSPKFHLSLIVVTSERLFKYDLFLVDSSYSFHWIGLKLGRQLDFEMIQGLLFWGYSTPSFDRVCLNNSLLNIMCTTQTYKNDIKDQITS